MLRHQPFRVRNGLGEFVSNNAFIERLLASGRDADWREAIMGLLSSSDGDDDMDSMSSGDSDEDEDSSAASHVAPDTNVKIRVPPTVVVIDPEDGTERRRGANGVNTAAVMQAIGTRHKAVAPSVSATANAASLSPAMNTRGRKRLRADIGASISTAIDVEALSEPPAKRARIDESEGDECRVCLDAAPTILSLPCSCIALCRACAVNVCKAKRAEMCMQCHKPVDELVADGECLYSRVAPGTLATAPVTIL